MFIDLREAVRKIKWTIFRIILSLVVLGWSLWVLKDWLFLIDLRETASTPEVFWTLTGLLALEINLWLLRDAHLDARAIERRGQNGAKKIAVRTAIGILVGLSVPQVIAVAIGVVLMLTPPENPARPVTNTLIIVTVGMVLIEASLTIVAFFTRVRRTQLLDYLESEVRETVTQRHAETMVELVHNTEVSTEARDGAQHAYQETDSINEKILAVHKQVLANNEAATDVARSLKEYMEGQEEVRHQREDEAEHRADARSEREQDRQDTRDDRRDERERART